MKKSKSRKFFEQKNEEDEPPDEYEWNWGWFQNFKNIILDSAPKSRFC